MLLLHVNQGSLVSNINNNAHGVLAAILSGKKSAVTSCCDSAF